MKINALDHGYIRLVDHMGNDQSIVRAARVSYDAAWRAGVDEGSDARLIRSLWRRGHTTPFEAVTFTFEVYAPIFVFRQWHRHRTQSYNELSARYRELPRRYYIPQPEMVGNQSKKSKQGRELGGNVFNREDELAVVREHCETAFHLYDELIKSNWPRELARMVLPVNTYSHMFCTMNLLNLFRFLTLRKDPHAQYEIRVYAEKMLHLILPIVPIATSAWEDEFILNQRKDQNND